jgi:hypothetical protein
VELYSVDKDGFQKTITAGFNAAGDLVLESWAYDRSEPDGYEREFNLTVAANEIPKLALALGTQESTSAILAEIQRRFTGLRADDDLHSFLNNSEITTEARSHRR